MSSADSVQPLPEATLREEQVERTRARILDAAVALLADDEPSELTVPQVARRAGVAVRTVYRYFPSKEAIVEGVATRVDGRLGPTPFPESIEGIRSLAPELFRQFSGQEDLLRATRSSRGARVVLAHTRASRIASAERALASLLEGASDEERRRAVAVVYSLHSTANYLTCRDHFGLSPEAAGAAAAWAVGLVLDDLERRAVARRQGGK